MPRLPVRLPPQFPLSKHACGLLISFACFCFCFCSVAIAQPVPSSQQDPKTDQTSPTSKSAGDQKKLVDFEEQVENSISRLGSIENKKVSESSGLATAAAAGCFWTINDGGNPAELFLFGDAGQELAQLKLTNAANKDWESLASFTFAGQRWGLVADVGDNLRMLDTHRLYFFLDPTGAVKPKADKKTSFTAKDFQKLKSVKALPFEFSYQTNSSNEPGSDGPTKKLAAIRQDCEAMAVDPNTLDIWFVEKVHLNRDRKVVPGIFILPMPKSQLAVHAGDLSAAATAIEASVAKPVARRIGSFPVRYVSGMSFSPDGKKLVIRNYLTAHLFIRPDNKTWRETVVEQKPMIIALPLQSQGEAICFTKDSQSVIVTSEGIRQPIWKVNLRVYYDKFNSQQ